MIRHRSVAGRVQGTRTRRGARRALSLFAAATTTVAVLPLAAPGSGAEAAPITIAAVTTAAATSTPSVTGPAPTVSGTLVVGSVLTADPGTWSQAPVTLTYQWYRSGTAITGATASTYRLTEADRTRPMTVVVIGRRTGYAARGHVSKATTPCSAGSSRTRRSSEASRGWAIHSTCRTAPGVPGCFGTAFSGTAPGWPSPGRRAARTWSRRPDRLRQITVTMIGRRDGYAAQARTSKPVRIWGEFTGGTPEITHFDPVTNTFTAAAGTWTPTPTAVRYQWYAWGKGAIPGATELTYTVAPEYRASWLQLRATATRDFYLPGSAYSEEQQPIEW